MVTNYWLGSYVDDILPLTSHLPTATGCTGGDNLFRAWRAWKYSHTSSMVSSIFFKKDFYFDCFDSKFNLF